MKIFFSENKSRDDQTGLSRAQSGANNDVLTKTVNS
jgi:hypothetical protein